MRRSFMLKLIRAPEKAARETNILKQNATRRRVGAHDEGTLVIMTKVFYDREKEEYTCLTTQLNNWLLRIC